MPSVCMRNVHTTKQACGKQCVAIAINVKPVLPDLIDAENLNFRCIILVRVVCVCTTHTLSKYMLKLTDSQHEINIWCQLVVMILILN